MNNTNSQTPLTMRESADVILANDFGINWSSNHACLFKEPAQCLIENDFKEGILNPKANTQTITEKCSSEHLGICFVEAESTKVPIFGFSEFVTALALLVVIYTVTDVRYRFRVLTAPVGLLGVTQFATAFIALGTLITDILFADGWLIPTALSNQAIWQGVFALTFLAVITVWLHYAFIRPPVFSKRNYKKYTRELYRTIAKGSDAELPIIADELRRSADSIVRLAFEPPSNRRQRGEKKPESDVSGYAHDLILLIANRKFCRHIISASPTTATAFFAAINSHKKYHLPIGQFAQNITAEALKNKDSPLYHEDEGYWSGLLGYIKPFSQTLYSNYDLVEALAHDHQSPLDVHYKVMWGLKAEEVEAYARAALIFAKSYSELPSLYDSRAMKNVIENIHSACRGLYKLNESDEWYPSDVYERLKIAMGFIKDFIDLLDKRTDLAKFRLRKANDRNEAWRVKNIFDDVAETIFDIMLESASIKDDSDKAWSIQHNAIWGEIFNLDRNNKALVIIQFKLRRLLFDEIKEIETLPNFKNAKALGYCLNMMGLERRKLSPENSYGKEWQALHRVVLHWTKHNYLKLVQKQHKIAAACIIGSISFDKDNKRLVKTYAEGLDLEPHREYLLLDEPPQAATPVAG